jgi:hypothetical protein
MAALLPITGTVSVTFDGCEATALGTFSIPVTTSIDAATGIHHLAAATDEAIITAMAEALRSTADQILATLPTAVAETIAVCPTCGFALGVMDASITIEHDLNGGHIENHRY